MKNKHLFTYVLLRQKNSRPGFNLGRLFFCAMSRGLRSTKLNDLASRPTFRVFAQLSGFPLNFSCFRSTIWFLAQLFVFSLNYLVSRSTFRVFAQLSGFPLNFSCFRSTIRFPAQLFVFTLNYLAFRSTIWFPARLHCLT